MEIRVKSPARFFFTFFLQTQKVRDFPKRELLGVKSPGFAKKRALSKKSPEFEIVRETKKPSFFLFFFFFLKYRKA